ncbi:MAG: class I SAM-dependent methyltransferase [Verrucomicrobiota bacterium]|jgi:predicted O-methyltransferase YrrM
MQKREFERNLEAVIQAVSGVEGYLTNREIRCLVLLASIPSAKGVVLEIGSFKGRSTIVLAKAALLAGESKIVAVDPLNSSAKTDPSLGGKPSAQSDFETNLKNVGLEHAVEFYLERSSDLARKWDSARKIRLLWIDGDHTYGGAKADFDFFRPFLADRAIVAMHDVLHSYDGPARVFAEDMLLSPHFGPAGFSGSIGWSQFFESPTASLPFHPQKLRLYGRLSKLISLTAFGEDLRGLRRTRYNLARNRIPHGDMRPDQFKRQIAFVN